MSDADSVSDGLPRDGSGIPRDGPHGALAQVFRPQLRDTDMLPRLMEVGDNLVVGGVGVGGDFTFAWKSSSLRPGFI